MKKKLFFPLTVIISLMIIVLVIFLLSTKTKDYFTVEFRLNGGVLISGSLKQTVKYGENAKPPVVNKDGEMFLEWSDDYTKITKNMVIYAIWDHKASYGLEFEVHYNGNYSLLAGCFDDLVGDVYVSAFYENRRVIGVNDYAFNNCNRITKVSLPDGIYSIGNYSFSNCITLKTMELPNTLVNIGEYCFNGCSSLENIVLPESLITIGKNAFNGCQNIKTIYLGKNVQNITSESFNNMSGLSSIIVHEENPYFMSIDGNLYSKDGKTLIKYASGKTDLVFDIPDSVEVIDSYAFENVSTLTKINISNNIFEFKQNAIVGCDNLQYTTYDNAYYIGNLDNPYLMLLKVYNQSASNITIHENTLFIYSDAFRDCINLETVSLPDGLYSIGNYAFYNCKSLVNVDIPLSVDYIGNNCFEECQSLESINVPSGVTILSDSTFKNCYSLKDVSLSKNLQSIESYAFYGCSSLEEIKLPLSLEYIGNAVFSSCTSLKEIVIPNNVKELGREAFLNCTALQNVTLSNSLEIIMTSAFSSCPSLKYLYIPLSVTKVESFIFTNSVLTIECEATSKPSGWSNLWVPITCTVIWNGKKK